MIKELIDKEKDRDSDQYYISTIDSLKQLITLSSDYGLSYAAENLYTSAQDLLNLFRYNHQIDHQLSILSSPSSSPSTDISSRSTKDSHSIIDDSIIFRACVLTPGVFDSIEHIRTTRSILTTRITILYNNIISTHHIDHAHHHPPPPHLSHNHHHPPPPHHHHHIDHIDEFVLSPTFYFAYQGYNDRDILIMLQESYIYTYPLLGRNEIIINVMNNYYFYQQYNNYINTSSSDVDINHNHHTHNIYNQQQQQQENGDDNYGNNNDNQYIDHNQSPSVASSTSTSISLEQLIIEERVRKIRVGFVSSYYRRHSICKLFCGKDG